MTKQTINGNVNFHASVPTYTQPKVIDNYMDDEGETVYILDNGRTTLKTAYEKLWMPIKGTIDMKSKGTAINGKQKIY